MLKPERRHICGYVVFSVQQLFSNFRWNGWKFICFWSFWVKEIRLVLSILATFLQFCMKWKKLCTYPSMSWFLAKQWKQTFLSAVSTLTPSFWQSQFQYFYVIWFTILILRCISKFWTVNLFLLVFLLSCTEHSISYLVIWFQITTVLFSFFPFQTSYYFLFFLCLFLILLPLVR